MPPSSDEAVLQAVGDFLSLGLGYQPEFVAHVESDDQTLQGKFFDRGQVYDYTVSADRLEYELNHADSLDVAEYVQGRLDAIGVRCDSANPYEYYKGKLGIRLDGPPLKCKNGTSCGGRCLPPGQKCSLLARIGGAFHKLNQHVGETQALNQRLSQLGEGDRAALERQLEAEKVKAQDPAHRKKEFNQAAGAGKATMQLRGKSLKQNFTEGQDFRQKANKLGLIDTHRLKRELKEHQTRQSEQAKDPEEFDALKRELKKRIKSQAIDQKREQYLRTQKRKKSSSALPVPKQALRGAAASL